MSIESIYQTFLKSSGVCTDTRQLKSGNLFFALKGPNFNANSFAKQAIELGAIAVVVDEPTDSSNTQIISVENTLITLQNLATHHRLQAKAIVIALTGSNGKTTTKELLNSVLRTTYKTVATIGNLNNHIGVPLTLLRIKPDTEIAIIEMGANHQKEITQLCNIALPDMGLITNVGKAHLEGFGGFEGVIKGKTEMYDFLKNKHRFIFYNADNEYLAPLCRNYADKLSYGAMHADVTGQLINDTPITIKWQNKNDTYDVKMQLVGLYNFENVLAAIAVGIKLKVPPAQINNGLVAYVSENQRSQLIQKQSNTILLDAYNANPTSMKAALSNFNKNYKAPHMIFLGDMYELGADEYMEHQAIINQLIAYDFETVVLVGKRFGLFTDKIKAHFFNTSIEACQWAKQQNITQTNILIKGSRSSAMEKVLDAFA
jgi:UDP-N-acetylmuramoyl-tripeptide--D-alanyl-D-alanine ligase